jgi:hypothetical protein
VSPEPPLKKPRATFETIKTLDKEIKKEVPRSKHENDSSGESENSDYDEILQKAFGVKRDRIDIETEGESSTFLAEYRQKEVEWRKRNLS